MGEFPRKSKSPDGRSAWCRACKAQHNKARWARDRARIYEVKLAWRQKNYDRLNTYNRQWDAEHRGRRTENQRRWKSANRIACRAHDRVRRAILAGRLSPQPCERCGASPAQAHHDDYSKPLDVRWLCARHHAGLHREARRRAQ